MHHRSLCALFCLSHSCISISMQSQALNRLVGAASFIPASLRAASLSAIAKHSCKSRWTLMSTISVHSTLGISLGLSYRTQQYCVQNSNSDLYTRMKQFNIITLSAYLEKHHSFRFLLYVIKQRRYDSVLYVHTLCKNT